MSTKMGVSISWICAFCCAGCPACAAHSWQNRRLPKKSSNCCWSSRNRPLKRPTRRKLQQAALAFGSAEPKAGPAGWIDRVTVGTADRSDEINRLYRIDRNHLQNTCQAALSQRLAPADSPKQCPQIQPGGLQYSPNSFRIL